MSDPTPNRPNKGKKIIATGGWTKAGASANRYTPPPTPPPISQTKPQHPPSLLNKVKSAVEAYASRGITQDKRCDEETKKVRSISCHGDSERGIAPCEFRRDSKAEEGRFYCGECGCGAGEQLG